MFGHTKTEEYGTKVVKENDSKREGSFCSVCGFEFKFQFKFEVGNRYSFCFKCDPCETRGSGQVPEKGRKEINHEGKTYLQLSYAIPSKARGNRLLANGLSSHQGENNSKSKSSTLPGRTALEICLNEQTRPIGTKKP